MIVCTCRASKEDLQKFGVECAKTRTDFPGLCAFDFEQMLNVVIENLIGWSLNDRKNKANIGMFGDVDASDKSQPMVKQDDYERFSVYFNYDNGASKVRGIYTQGNPHVIPIFEAWLEPFHDLEATHVSLRRTTTKEFRAWARGSQGRSGPTTTFRREASKPS